MTSKRSRNPASDADARFLRRRRRPCYERGESRVRVVDLFCGCGGMTLGIAEAARRLGVGIEIPLAVDVDERAVAVFQQNFPAARVRCTTVESCLDGAPGAKPTAVESRLRRAVGGVDILLGGPPCQGHSDLNNRTRRKDARNELYLRMARAAEILAPRVVLIENVPPVLNDRGRVVERTIQALQRAGYSVASQLANLLDLGIPQRRRRHLLLATRGPLPPADGILEKLLARRIRVPRDVKWAIGDLRHAENSDPLHRAARLSAENRTRIDWLFRHRAFELPDQQRPPCHRDRAHTYRSVYGRLKWSGPAQTITSGFMSPGQGRNVHPSERRTLTPREAARLQFFPDFFDFTPVETRTALADMIGGAVPPKLTMELGILLIPSLRS